MQKIREKYQEIILWVFLMITLLLGLASKLVYSLNRIINSDDVIPAMYFYDVVFDKNYLLKNWCISRSSYLFTDFPLYLIAGLTFGLDAASLKAITFFIYLLSISALFYLILRNWGLLPAFIALVSLSSVSLLGTFILLRAALHIGTIAFSFVSLLIVTVIIKTEEKGDLYPKIFYYILLILLSVLAVFSDPFYIFIFTIPVVVSFIFLNLIKVKIASLRKCITLILILSGSAFSGIALQEAAFLDVYFTVDLKVGFASFMGILGKISLFWQDILELFNINIFYSDKSLLSYFANFGIDISDNGSSLVGFLFKSVELLFVVFVILSSFLIFRKETNNLKKFIILFF